MVRISVIALGLALFATRSSAQTTHCEQSIIGMPSAGVDCTTTRGAPDPATPARMWSWKEVPPRPCSKLQTAVGGADPSYCAAREIAATRKGIGDLIAAGKCDEAIKAALGTGDLQFAGEVRAYCASQPR